MTLDWDNPAFSGPLCRYCARPRATTEARNFWKEQGCAAEGHGSEILCWNESETACGAWLKPHEAYELAVKDVVAWLRENNDLKRCWTLADAIEAGAHFGKAGRK